MPPIFYTLENTTVYCTVHFIGFHRWKDAPAESDFLREYHRHVFHVQLGVSVEHTNRQVEFLILQNELLVFVNETFTNKYFEYSCEQIGEIIVDHMIKKYSVSWIKVSEDGENGSFSIVEYFSEDGKTNRINGSRVDEIRAKELKCEWVKESPSETQNT